MADVRRTIEYQGAEVWVSMLVQMLKAEDVEVEPPPQGVERRSVFTSDLNDVTVNLVVAGTLYGIKTAVAKFRGRVKHGKVTVDGDDPDDIPDDGGFLG